MEANRSGDSMGALSAASAARHRFRASGNDAGSVFAAFEYLYALHRLSRAYDCIKAAQVLRSALARTHYVWLMTQIDIESSGCQGMAGHFKEAWQTVNDSILQAERHGLQATALRALAFKASLHTFGGRLRESWRTNTLGLSSFWSGYYPDERGFQFYSDLEFAAEEDQDFRLAAIAQGEALSMIVETGRFDVQGIGHFRLAELKEMAGDKRAAQDEFNEASLAFRKIPELSRGFYEAYSQLELAGFEARSGELSSAVKRLLRAQHMAQKTSNSVIRLSYLRARAEVDRSLGLPEEKDFLRQIVVIGNRVYRDLHTEKERWDWQHIVDPSYRALLSNELQEPHDPLQALADWELYKSIKSGNKTPIEGPAVNNREARRLLLVQLDHLTHSTFVSFAVFPDAVTAWVSDNRGVREFHLSGNSASIQPLVDQFYQLCSDPATPLKKVKTVGRRLYDWLIAPIADALDQKRTLYVESDEALSVVPLSALVLPDGRYLGESFNTVHALSLLWRPRKWFGRDAAMKQVLIAYPGAVTFEGEEYRPLPGAEEEASNIARLFPGSVYLHGHHATVTSLLHQLPNASIFHYAGHSLNRTQGGDLIAQGPNGGVALPSSEIARLPLRNTYLAVLSACSTAGGINSSWDPHGLVRSFLSAGTKYVIASRWEVDSSGTATLMKNMYSAILHGSLTADAIGESKRRMIDGGQHPYYWSAFDVFGTATNETHWLGSHFYAKGAN